MPVTGPIPLPGAPGESFLKGASGVQSLFDSMAQNRLHQAQARKSDVLSQLLGGLQSQGGGTPGGQSDINKAILASSMLGIKPVEANGKIYTGFGTFDINESAQQKREGETNQALKQKVAETNLKTAGDYEKHALSLKNLDDVYGEMDKLLKKNPSLTGKLKGGLAKLDLSSDPDLAAFQELTTKAQGELAKLAAGSKTGIGSINWVATGKPGISKPGNYNIGMINQSRKDIRKEHELMKKLYKKTSGNELDINLSPTGEDEKNDLDKMAQDAIAQGAPREAVMQELARIKAEGVK